MTTTSQSLLYTYLLLVQFISCKVLLYTTEPSASLTIQGYHIRTPCLIKPQGGLSDMFCKNLLRRALLKASRSWIVVISAGRVFHRRGPNTTNDDS